MEASILSNADMERAILEMVAHSDRGALNEDEILAGVNELTTLAISHGLFENWVRGNVHLGYNTEHGEITFQLSAKGEIEAMAHGFLPNEQAP